MLTNEEIEHLALLSRLELSGTELARYRGDLERILAYVGELKTLDTEVVSPMHHVLGIENVVREDRAPILRDESMAARLVAMAPREKNGYIMVPRILYHE